MRTEVEGGEEFDFSMQSIFWINLFTGNKSAKTSKILCRPSKNLISWVLTIQTFINIALVVFKLFKMVTPTTLPMKFNTKETCYKWVQREKWPYSSKNIIEVSSLTSLVHLIYFCGWPSEIVDDLLKFRGNPFLHLPESLLLNRSFLLCVSKKVLWFTLNTEELTKSLISILSS